MANLGALNEYLAADYELRQAELNRSLGCLAVETSIEEARQNVTLLTDIFKILPVVENGKMPPVSHLDIERPRRIYVLAAETPAFMRAIQSTFVWQGEIQGEANAFLLVGNRHKNPLQEEILLVGCFEGEGLGVYKVSISRRRFAGMQKKMQDVLFAPLSEDEASEASYGNEETLLIHGSSQGSVKYSRFNYNGNFSIKPVLALSNFTLSQYNVFDYVNEIALRFGKIQEVKDLIEASTG